MFQPFLGCQTFGNVPRQSFPREIHIPPYKLVNWNLQKGKFNKLQPLN
jgi:hypothetical protein